jgi:hypothetical protein
MTTTMMATHARFTYGAETRRQPARKRRDFEELLAIEQRYARLVEAFSVRQTPAVSAAARRFPRRYMAEHSGTELASSLDRIEEVSNCQATIATNKLKQRLEQQCIMGN